MSGRRGFTLLEVLVAVAILGLWLTTILAGQFKAVKQASHARHLNVAIGLARCRMSEIEEELRIDGYQETDVNDSGICCEGAEAANVSCEWFIEKPTFPDPDFGALDLDSDLDTSALGKLAAGATAGAATPEGGDLSNITDALSGDGDLAEAAAGGIGGVASLVMGLVYPDIKTLFEASTRRVTVVLTWTEGSQAYEIELVQWVTQPQPGMAGELPEGMEGAEAASGSTGTSAAGATPRGGTASGASKGTSKTGGRQ
jgi:general secretion pathway protein I